jgi:hypothetical protein
MAEDKRNRGDQQQGGNQSQDRQRGNRDRKPGGGSMEQPGSDNPRRDQEEQQE